MSNDRDNALISDSNSIMDFSIIASKGDRDEQQDCFGYSIKKDEGIIVICDGMGGRSGGRIASATAVERFISEYNAACPGYDPCEILLNGALLADKKVADLISEDGQRLNAGSTAVAVIIRQNELYWCSVGDSRAYIFRNNELIQITKDQNYKTVLEEQLQAGFIDIKEYQNRIKQGDALISYIGIRDLSLIDNNQAPILLHKNDKIIITTDGMYRLLSDKEIKEIILAHLTPLEIIQSMENAVGNTAKRVNAARDNMTVAAINICR